MYTINRIKKCFAADISDKKKTPEISYGSSKIIFKDHFRKPKIPGAVFCYKYIFCIKQMIITSGSGNN